MQLVDGKGGWGSNRDVMLHRLFLRSSFSPYLWVPTTSGFSGGGETEVVSTVVTTITFISESGDGCLHCNVAHGWLE